MADTHVVTGAYGYSGKHIAKALLAQGHAVRTLTNSPRREDALVDVPAYPLDFDRPETLAHAMRGATTLINTYWVRFDYAGRDLRFSLTDAVERSRTLFRAAKDAGVERIVHVSITNPSPDSDLPYFRGKAQVEEALRETAPSFAILRPATLFGHEDILVNNIAWMLRRLPVFGVFGDGEYPIRPIHVDDLATLAAASAVRRENTILDAVGPERFTFRSLVRTIADAIGKPRPIVSVPTPVGHWVTRAVGVLTRDVVLTRDEIQGLKRGLLDTHAPPTGQTRLSDWARAHAEELGRRYASELARRRDRRTPYQHLTTTGSNRRQ